MKQIKTRSWTAIILISLFSGMCGQEAYTGPRNIETAINESVKYGSYHLNDNLYNEGIWNLQDHSLKPAVMNFRYLLVDGRTLSTSAGQGKNSLLREGIVGALKWTLVSPIVIPLLWWALRDTNKSSKPKNLCRSKKIAHRSEAPHSLISRDKYWKVTTDDGRSFKIKARDINTVKKYLQQKSIWPKSIEDITDSKTPSLFKQDSKESTKATTILWNIFRSEPTRWNFDDLQDALHRGANPNVNLGGGTTPLMKIVSNSPLRTDLLELLFRFRASINDADDQLRTPLMYAARARFQNKLAIEILLRHGANVDATDAHKSNALLYASKNPMCSEFTCQLIEQRSNE